MIAASLGFFAALVVSTTRAFSTGAGGCAGGSPAVIGTGSPHAAFDSSGSIVDLGASLTIDGEPVLPGSEMSLVPGVEHTIVLEGVSFRGVLFRLESVVGGDMTGTMTPGEDLGNAFACTSPIAGVTHGNRDIKTSASFTLTLDRDDVLALDLNVVVAASEHYYSSYTIFVLEETVTEAPTFSPTTSPLTLDPTPEPTQVPSMVAMTDSPTDLPSNMATETPTDMPSEEVLDPTPEPTNSPSMTAMTDSPTDSPTNMATETPTSSPTNLPSEQMPEDTDVPTMGPTVAPTGEPTIVPTTLPTSMPIPTDAPTDIPTILPTQRTMSPVSMPTGMPTDAPVSDTSSNAASWATAILFSVISFFVQM